MIGGGAVRNSIIGAMILFSVAVTFLIFNKVEIIRMGGPVMMLIILSSIIALTVIIEKISQFSKESIDPNALMNSIIESIERQRIKEAIDLCDQTNTAFARVIKAGIVKYDRPKEEIKEAMQDAFLYENPVLEEKLPILATILQVVPLFGFLGTLLGLMEIFKSVYSKVGYVMPQAGIHFVSGIAQALICSVSAFLVAIPVLVAYNYLEYKVKSLTQEIEQVSTRLLSFLIDRRMP